MAVTGDVCINAGTYRSVCRCHSLATLNTNTWFPRCIICERRAEWEQVGFIKATSKPGLKLSDAVAKAR